jgi:hypothetical protein
LAKPQAEPPAAPGTDLAREALERLRAQMQEGQRPDPAQLREALAQARAQARALAAGLDLRGREPANPAGLPAYEEALRLCLDLTQLGVELTRRHGPEFLPAPDEAV